MTQPNCACGDESLRNDAANRSDEKSHIGNDGRLRSVEHHRLGKPGKSGDFKVAWGFCCSALHVAVQCSPDILHPSRWYWWGKCWRASKNQSLIQSFKALAFFFDSPCPLLWEVDVSGYQISPVFLRAHRWEQNIDFCLDTLSLAWSRAVSLSLT